jgi:hypothetical protein
MTIRHDFGGLMGDQQLAFRRITGGDFAILPLSGDKKFGTVRF